MLKNEKGTALLMALIILLLLTLIGFAAITTSSIEVQISGNQRVGITAMYAFEAGIESSRQELNNFAGTAPNVFPLSNSSSSNPSYAMYRAIQSYPYKGNAGGGDLWRFYNDLMSPTKGKVIVAGGARNIDGSDMFAFLVEGTSGFARKSVEVGIVPSETSAAAGGTPDPSGTGYVGGSN